MGIFFNRKKDKQPQAQDQSADQDNSKKKTHLDKLLMGAIMGVAVGSVVGMAVTPKKQEKGPEQLTLLPDSKNTENHTAQHPTQVTTPHQKHKNVKSLKPKKKGFFAKFFGKKPKDEEILKTIPNEQVEQETENS